MNVGAVVLLTAEDERGRTIVGSGAVLSQDGRIVTTASSVIDVRTNLPYKDISVVLGRDRQESRQETFSRKAPATVVAFDPLLDLALIRLTQVPPGLQTVPFGHAEEIRRGDPITVIGHGDRGRMWTISGGTVTGDMEDYLRVRGRDVFRLDRVKPVGRGAVVFDGGGHLIALVSGPASAAPSASRGSMVAVKATVIQEWAGHYGLKIAYSEPAEPPQVQLQVRSINAPVWTKERGVLTKPAGRLLEGVGRADGAPGADQSTHGPAIEAARMDLGRVLRVFVRTLVEEWLADPDTVSASAEKIDQVTNEVSDQIAASAPLDQYWQSIQGNEAYARAGANVDQVVAILSERLKADSELAARAARGRTVEAARGGANPSEDIEAALAARTERALNEVQRRLESIPQPGF
jgi:hypothetical protein